MDFKKKNQTSNICIRSFAMDIQVSKYRTLLKAVGKQLSTFKDRVDADTLLAISQDIQPSKLGILPFFNVSPHTLKFSHVITVCVVKTGGHLFDAYVTLSGSYTTMGKWRRYCGRKDQNGVILLCSQLESDEIVEAEKNYFLGFCILQCGRVCSKSRTQLFFHTWTAVFHGLSRIGVHMLAQMGMAMKISAFDTQRHIEVDRCDQRTR